MGLCPSVVTHTALPGCSSGNGLAWFHLPKILVLTLFEEFAIFLVQYFVRFSWLDVRLLLVAGYPSSGVFLDIDLLKAVHTIEVMLSYRREHVVVDSERYSG